jgi:hypothetical protein
VASGFWNQCQLPPPRDAGRSAIPMSPNESRPQNPNKSLSEAVQTGATRRFRWSTIPAALSGLFGLLALVAIPIGIFQNIEVYQNPSNRMMFFAALGMPIGLLVAGTLNVVGSFRWIRVSVGALKGAISERF